jgi:F0F1-type ATP synthase assembly protein I
MNRRLLALRLTGLGWYVATCIVVGVVGGVLLDKWLGLKPLFTLLGILLGTTAAFYGLFKMIQPLITPEQSGEPDDKSPSNGGNP